MARTYARRRVLALLGGASVSLAGCSTGPADDGTTTVDDGWSEVESPTEMTLYSATISRSGPCAVGEGGRLVRRVDGRWRLELEAGPTGAQNGLRGVDATANGRRVWFCGDSGVVGRYDVDRRRATDFSAPNGKTSTWEDVAVAGLSGQEWVFLVNGSGELVLGRHDGDGVTWRDPVKPGSGSSALSVSFANRGTGYVCDTSGNVFQTVDAGKEWRRIGIDGAGVDLYDVTPRGPDNVFVAGGSGTVFRYNGFSWTPVSVGEEEIRGIERDRHAGLAVDASGGAYELTRNGWQRRDPDAEVPLYDVVLGSVEVPDVAVGAGGAVLERPR